MKLVLCLIITFILVVLYDHLKSRWIFQFVRRGVLYICKVVWVNRMAQIFYTLIELLSSYSINCWDKRLKSLVVVVNFSVTSVTSSFIIYVCFMNFDVLLLDTYPLRPSSWFHNSIIILFISGKTLSWSQLCLILIQPLHHSHN